MMAVIISIIVEINWYHVMNCCPHHPCWKKKKNLYIEILTPNMTTLGGGNFGK